MTIPISLTTQLREQKKLCDFYRERNLTLSQAFEEQDAVLRNRESRIAELESRIQSLEPTPEDGEEQLSEALAAPDNTAEQVH